jgi:hypothetical protein
MAGLSITPVSKRKSRSGNENQNKQLGDLDARPARPAPKAAPKPRGDDPNNPDAKAFLKRMKERQAARKAR